MVFSMDDLLWGWLSKDLRLVEYMTGASRVVPFQAGNRIKSNIAIFDLKEELDLRR